MNMTVRVLIAAVAVVVGGVAVGLLLTPEVKPAAIVQPLGRRWQ